MSDKKRSLLPKFEVIIIIVFFMSFIIWAMSRCNDIRKASGDMMADTRQQQNNTIKTEDNSAIRDTIYVTKRDTTQLAGKVRGRLYITIDKLKVRTEPGLKSTVLVQLPLFEEVAFLDEVTDSTYQINLGYVMADEPYVKIRTSEGIEGWVYGAGVNYYKKKRQGAL